jgi:hypothetical protein
MAEPAFPSFYLIGAERCGVRWLRHNLDQHPDICAPPVDVHYFADLDLMKARGARWYRRLFESWNGEAFLGETSPGYLAWGNGPRQIAGRLHRAVPDARLVAIVRQPLDRMRSATSRAIEVGDLPPVGPDGSFDLAWMEPLILHLVRGGVYTPNLAGYRELFGDQLQILLYDDLVDDPAGLYRAVLRHLGADDSFVPPDVERVRYQGRGPQLDPGPVEARAAMYETVRGRVDELGEWLGRDLSFWDPAVSGV